MPILMPVPLPATGAFLPDSHRRAANGLRLLLIDQFNGMGLGGPAAPLSPDTAAVSAGAGVGREPGLGAWRRLRAERLELRGGAHRR